MSKVDPALASLRATEGYFRCACCGKKFFVVYAGQYAFKRVMRGDKNMSWFCGWNCFNRSKQIDAEREAAEIEARRAKFEARRLQNT